MARRRIHALAVAALALWLAPAGCKQSDTVLLVEVYGDAALVPFQFNVFVSTGIAGETRAIRVPETLDPAGSFPLPQSFTISMDRSRSGPILISVSAYDVNGVDGLQTIAAGT